jgi:hypothetical protein
MRCTSLSISRRRRHGMAEHAGEPRSSEAPQFLLRVLSPVQSLSGFGGLGCPLAPLARRFWALHWLDG